MSDEDVAFLGVIKQTEMLRSGKLSAPQLLDVYLKRIERLNPLLNCFNAVYAESARAEAVAAQARLDRGESAPLLGIPVAIKDNFDIAGKVTGHGTSAATEPARTDSEIVRRLREAGAVIIGKTNLPEFAMWGHFTESKTNGITRNPWQTEHSAGGSSGGSASAVAAGLVPIALASDGGGSIRVPSAHCGLFGIKPTRGRVSLAPLSEHWFGLSVAGSVARSVADCALFLDVVAGAAVGDKHVATPPARPFLESAATDPPKLKIAVSTRAALPRVKIDEARRRALDQTGAWLRELGHDVKSHNVQSPMIALQFMARYFKGIAQEAASLGNTDRLEPRSRRAIQLSRLFSDEALARSLKAETAVLAKIKPVFDEFDVVMTPTIAQQPAKVGTLLGAGWFKTFNTGSPYVGFTSFWNFTGNPAASVPVGFDADGLPLAIQLVGRIGEEATLISLAAQLERAHPWADKRPHL